jgi:hypothetical protein
MHLLLGILLTLIVSWSAWGQAYTINTAAGTGAANPAGASGGDGGPATSTHLNGLFGVTVDAASVLRLAFLRKEI